VLVLGCLIAMTVYAAEEGTTETVTESAESGVVPASEEAAETVPL
jgi:hypothetical protein